MSIRLINEVLDHAPAGLAPLERLLLVVIAEAADDKTRRCWPGIDVLTRRVGVGQRQIARVLAQLEKRGYPLRVPSGVDRRGHPVFAARGHRTTYQLPELRPPKPDT